MPVSMDEFFTKRAVFLRGLSEITGVAMSKIRIVGVRQMSTPRRRLLLARIRVDTEFVVESRAMAREAVLLLTLERLNLKNADHGLPTLRLVSVAIPTVPTTPIGTPEPYGVVRVFVYRLRMSVGEFDAKRDAFRRALALAYAVLLERVVVKSVARFAPPSRDTQQLLPMPAGIEVGVAISFSNIARSEAVVPVSAINNALRQEGLPAVVELVVADGTKQPAAHQSSDMPIVYTWIFNGVGAATFVLVLCVCIRLGFGRFCLCCSERDAHSHGHPNNEEHSSTTGAQTFFTMDAHTPVGYAFDDTHVRVQQYSV